MKANTSLLIILLITASFFLGKLWTEVTILKGQPLLSLTNISQPLNTKPTPTAVVTLPAKGAKVDLKITKADATKGNANAKVTIVEFADFQCPFCGAVNGGNKSMIERMSAQTKFEPLFPGLDDDYIKSGKVRFVYKDFAFLDNGSDTGESHLSAQAAYCAGDQQKYWEYHDYLYSHQTGENQGAFAQDKLEGFANDLGLEPDAFKNCLTSKKYLQKVKDYTKFGESIGVNGTPTMYLNGVLMVDSSGQSGTFPYSFIKQKIEEALKK